MPKNNRWWTPEEIKKLNSAPRLRDAYKLFPDRSIYAVRNQRYDRRRTKFIPDDKIRFWANVDKNGPLQAHCKKLGRCWMWNGYRQKSGHGQGCFGGRTQGAHRIAWIISDGDIPDGVHILHRCDNPPCVRRSHLFQGDQVANMKDCSKKGRNAVGEKIAQAKLTGKEVSEIRKSYAHGNGLFLSKKYGVARSTISAIVNGKLWRHI